MGDSTRTWAPALWLVALIGLVFAVEMAGGEPFAPQTWVTHDSEQYLSIATDGYDLFRCPPDAGGAEKWCGNGAFFPGFPTLVWLIGLVGVDADRAAMVLAWGFALGTLVLLARTFLRDVPPVAALGALAMAALWPGHVFLHALLPLSMLVFFVVLALWWLTRERWTAAGIAAGLAIAAHPAGLVLLALAAVHGRRAGARSLLRFAAPAGAGVAFVVLLMRIQTDNWTAFFKMQDSYDRPRGWPWVNLWDRVADPLGDGLDVLADANALQGLLVLVVIGAVLSRARRFQRVDWLVIGATLPLWLFALVFADPTLQGRGDAVLLPLVVLLRHLPATVTFALGGSALTLAIVVDRAFTGV